MIKLAVNLNNTQRQLILKIRKFPKKKTYSKLCIYSHFDRDHKIDSYVLYALQAMQKEGYEIIFVTASDQLSSEELLKLKLYVSLAIVKKNIGYDFMSWKIGLSMAGDYTKYKQIVHMNDSIFFPVSDPKIFFNVMRRKKLDFWGLIDSYNIQHHIQSFFWVFEEKFLQSQLFNHFWNNCEILHDKQTIINKYEFAFAKQVRQRGFKIGTLISFDEMYQKFEETIKPQRRYLFKQVNPSYHLWDILIRDFKAPYLKKNILLGTHPDYNVDTIGWDPFMEQNSSYPRRMIDQYIQRMEAGKHREVLSKDDIVKWMERLSSIVLSDQKIVIYGYGQIGRLVHAMGAKVVGAVDINWRNTNTLNHLYGIPLSVKPLDHIYDMAYDKILICSIGYEAQAVDALLKIGIEKDCIVYLSDELHQSLSSLLLILRTAIRLSFFEAREGRKVVLSSGSLEFVEMLRRFLNFLNLYPNFIQANNVLIDKREDVFSPQIFVEYI